MKKFFKVVAGIVLIALAAGAVFAVNLIWFRPFFIDHFFERVFVEYALEDPELLSSLRIIEQYGLKFHQDDLTDASWEHAEELMAKAKRDLSTLRAYDRDGLDRSQQLSAEIMEWYLSNTVAGEKWMYHNYPVNQLFGVQSDLPDFMINIHQVNDERDARDYIARLEKFTQKFDQVYLAVAARENKGIVPPAFVLTRVLAEMRNFSETPAKENALYTRFVEKLEKAGIDNKVRMELLADCVDAIEKHVYPAYAKLIEICARQEEEANAQGDGVWMLLDGDDYYEYALHDQTTTDMTPEQVHRIGLEEVDRIQREMTKLLDSVGAEGDSVGTRMLWLAEQPQFVYPDTDEGRTQVLADYQTIIDEIDAGMDKIFDLRPAAGVKVERIPVFKEKTAPGAYYMMPALDGSRPGIFYANLRDMTEIQKYGMRTLAYHEAIPGHHFQIAIQQELEGPTFRKMPMFTAYIEGWALYAEQLAWEHGYQEDPYSNLGRLQAELFRAVRLVVDTGIHFKRWTREQGIEYMSANTGMPEGDVVAEIERYIVSPGQACAYKIGMMKILELRDRARQKLGPQFSLKEFHNVVLKDGALPLDILEQQVDRYIGERQPKLAMAGCL